LSAKKTMSIFDESVSPASRPRRKWRFAGIGLALWVAGCASRDEKLRQAASARGEALQPAGPVAAASGKPISADSESSSTEPGQRLLAVPGFEPAVVVVPSTARRTPLLVATHGAGGDPDWECERWGRVARGRWLVLCPRGVALRRGEEGSYYYPDHLALEREVTAAVAAARATYGALITATDGVYLGYSQGATMGALMLVEHGAEFPHLVLIEGGSGDWTLARARRFKATGGQSVFIVCGTEPCARRATASSAALERAGLHARAEYAPRGGHTELGPVGQRAERWLETLAVAAR